MGITGLIPFLEKASSKVNLREFRGTTMAVDTYCWLHKGVFCCADKLARGEETDKYLQYCLRYVQLLLSHDIKPILVFDGRHLPAKALTELRRREARQTSKKLAADLLRSGRTEEARSHMRRCIDVTHEMALKLIHECRIRNVDCIVAPYEADAQLAWLNKMNLAQYIITEDSDLTLFGATKIIFKLDITGAGLLVETNKLYLAMGCNSEKYTFEKFRRMCILSGCDYLDSLPGIGLAKACKFMLMTEEDDMRRALKKIPAYLNMRQLDVNENYIESFLKAEATFRHMYIYNPLERRMERLNSLDVYKTDEILCSNAGTLLEDEQQAFQLALGNLNPFTLKALDNWHPDSNVSSAKTKGVTRAKHKSIWDAKFTTSHVTKSEKKNHAMFFKKVDFISQILDKKLKVDEKPAESDVVNMYLTNNQTNYTNQTNKEVVKNTNITVTPNKSAYNPFVKKPYENGKISPPVCPNSSLIKAITPQKVKEEEDNTPIRFTPPSPRPSPVKTVNKFKRSLFQSQVTTATTTLKPLVKSRFFSNNLNQSLQSPNTDDAKDIYKKLAEIEESIKKQKEHLELFYNDTSSSPQKKIPRLEDALEDTITVNNNNIEVDTVLLISDEESNCASSPLKINEYKCKTAPRLGLSKKKSATKSKQTATPATQSLLSKFGFQRKPVLK